MQKLKIFCLFVISLILLAPNTVFAGFHSGKIYLQVEANGEAWYINPLDNYRHYLGRPDDAFSLMRNLGLGISNANIAKIPVGLLETTGLDSDLDGISDDQEIALGTNPNNPDTDEDDYSDYEELQNKYNPLAAGRQSLNNSLINQLRGRILLQVEKNGEAWYLNPNDDRRYFLGRPEDAFEVMRSLGIGITNSNLAKIKRSYVKTTRIVDGHYSLKYPEIWQTQTNEFQGDEYNKMNISDSFELIPELGGGYLRIYVLESSKDFTLGDFNKTIRDTEKVLTDDYLIGVKPAKKQKFVYKSTAKVGDQTFESGAVIHLDIMINTNKFIHLRSVAYKAEDIELFENFLDELMSNLTLIY